MQSSRFALQSIVLAAFVSLALFFSCSSDDGVADHTHDAADINTGTLANARLDMGMGRGIDADMVDGQHASAFAASVHNHDTAYASLTHNHDAVYLRLIGGTLTGALNLPANGLTVGTNQLKVSGGNVGVGTASPAFKLEVDGTVYGNSATGHGLRGGTSDPSSAAVYGNSAAGHGIEGVSSGAGKNGVRGSSSADHGVYGTTSSLSHAGVYGTSTNGDAVFGQSTGGGSGVVGTTTDPNFVGVNGQSTAGHGVYGSSTAAMRAGVYGLSTQNYGIIGETQNNAFAGIHGFSQVGDGVAGTTQALVTNWAGSFSGDVGVAGNHFVTGTKSFVQRHPHLPDRAIVYVCLEGGEAGTYCRGTASLLSGSVTIELPEHFTLVTAEEGITVQVTPMGPCNGLYVESFDHERIVVRELMNGTSDARFHYTVNGVRKGYEDFEPITDSAKLLKKLDQADAQERGK